MLRKNNDFYVEHTDRPSRFMVDLNLLEKQNQKEEDIRTKKSGIVFLFWYIFKILKKLFLSFDKVLDSIRLFLMSVISKVGSVFVAKKKKESVFSRIRKRSTDVNRLAIFSFFKFFKNSFLLFSNFSTKIGVTIVGFVRNFFQFKKSNKERAEKSNSFTGTRFAFLKSPLILAVVMLVIISPFKIYTFSKALFEMKGRVLGVSELAVGSIVSAKDSASQLDFGEAGKNFDSARNNFEQARSEVGQISSLLFTFGKIVPNKNIKLASYADAILEAGSISASLGNHLTTALSSVSADDKSVKSVVESFYENSRLSSGEAKKLLEIVNSINPDYLPDEYKEKFNTLKDKTIILEESLVEFVDILEKARIFLGFEYDKRYLLVFQNNTELRASGGFIGSYAIVDFRNGEIRNIEAPGGGSYDTEGGLRERIVAPAPLHLVNPLWHFWDANWWPDWKKSAEKLMWFYERSGGSSVDGVIAFTPTMLESILEAIGPVDMTDDYGVVIDADNFWLTAQTFAEQKQDVTNKPKKIIGDMFHEIVSILPDRLNKDSFLDLSLKIEEAFSERHALFYFVDDVLQQKMEDNGWAGRMRNTAWDYLMVVNSNIAGGKSDREMKEEIIHASVIDEDGAISNIVKINRIHTGSGDEEFSGVRNVNWMRIYVPEGSELLEARGFVQPDRQYFEDPEDWWEDDPDVLRDEAQMVTDIKSGTKIYQESGKTVFANWSMVDAGKTATIYIKYRLPFKLKSKKVDTESSDNLTPYALLVQKQPGTIGSDFKSILKLPDSYKNVWQYPENENMVNRGWNKSAILDTDKYWAVILEN
jgi:hypothetical protein